MGEIMINLMGLIISHGSTMSMISTIFSILPTIEVTNRRLRDLGMNALLTTTFLIPCVNLILALVFFTRNKLFQNYIRLFY